MPPPNPILPPPPGAKPRNPFHAKRPHRKSRTGCRACKARKVKCDEARPTCRSCVLRREECTYLYHGPPSPPGPSSPSPSSASAPDDAPASRSTPSVSPRPPRATVSLVAQPQHRPPDTSALDMKLLWWYTTLTYTSFSTELGQPARRHDILQQEVPRRAFETPFLMDVILCLSACHMQALRPGEIDAAAVAAYRARAFSGYRRAIEEWRPESDAGLLAGSLMLVPAASQTFREAARTDAAAGDNNMYILDWMVVWRGIGAVIELLPHSRVRATGLSELFYRPAVDLDAAAAHVPPGLLDMVSSTPRWDDELPCAGSYLTTLRYLGALRRELRAGRGPVLRLQIATWITFVPGGFVDAARLRRPRALVILAHYLCFLKLLDKVWWLAGVADRELAGLLRHLGPAWGHRLAVPRAVLAAGDAGDVARVLLGDLEREAEVMAEKAGGPEGSPWFDEVGEPIKECPSMGGPGLEDCAEMEC